ncbi:MAG: PEGA domain-containing protein [Terriglobales bacterium]
MFRRRSVPVILAIMALLSLVHAEDRVQSELKFVAHTKAEKTAGVWVDGQYVGFVKELNGDKKIVLLPGKHEVLVRQAWYKDYVQNVILEPGQTSVVNVSLVREARPAAGEATGELKISATPSRAAVFVDKQFAGHVDEFDGVGKAMLLTPGRHSVRVALPGYLPFETVVDLRPHQKLKIQTELVKGSITEAGSLVNQQ